MTIEDQTAEAVALFDQFVLANTCQSILSVFQKLCDCLDVHPTEEAWFYHTLKSKLTHWKAVSLWNRLDKRFNHKEYSNHKACSNTRVLVIGAGPCGLRCAIECKLLGARVVVVEKRDRFSRNNVLHLWPFVIHDLKSLGAKVFYPKFCAGSIDHISIRQLQCVLMKISLMLGVEIYTNVGYEDLLEPSPLPPVGGTGDAEQKGWRAQVSPSDHPVSCYDFDVLIGADGKRNTLQGFSRKEFRGKLAIAITANFINHQTTEEARVEEISGVAFIFNQKFFKDLTAQTGIDLENIVYYKDDTHYFVMTAKKHSLLQKGVLLQDQRDTIKLLSRDNVNQEALQNYAREAADVSTNHKLPNLEFAHNHFGQPDIAMFDFTSLFAAENSSRALEKYGRKLLINIVGDSLLEPFWPTGSGCARGFLGCFDAAWSVRSWASGSVSPLQVLAERESVYMLLSQTTPESLSKSFNSYTINPKTRYKHCNTQALKCIQVRHLYDTTETIDLDDLEPVRIPAKRARTYDIMVDHSRLLRWCNKKLALLPSHLRCEITDLTTSWKDGRLFCLLLHLYSPDAVPVDNLNELTSLERLTNAFNIASSQWSILPMLTPEEIVSCDEPDKLFMVSYISQFYTTLRDKRPIGAAPEFLVLSPSKKASLSPSAAKIPSLRKLGKIIGSGGRTARRRKSSSSQKSPRERTRSKDGGQKSPNHLLSPSDRKSSKLRSTGVGPSSPKRSQVSPKHGKLASGTLDLFKVSTSKRRAAKKDQKAPSTDTVKSRMKEIRDAFSLKSKRPKSTPPPPKKTALRDDWVAGKYEKLEEYDQRFNELSRRMEPGNIGNTNPGKRGSNLVSEVASRFEKATPESSPVLHRKSRPVDGVTGLDALLNREPRPNEICFFCKKRIYLVERQSAEGKFFHRSCFRCYFCDVSLHMGSYTLHRTSLGQGRFYCDQHVGKERLSTGKKRSSDMVDSRPTSAVFDMVDDRPISEALDSAKVRSDTASGKQLVDSYATPERIEFENSIDYGEEETEELQTQHNLGGLSPTAAEEIHWHSESETDSDSDMDVVEEDEEEEEIIPTIDDVLDQSSWKRQQRLHMQTSNSSDSTSASATTAASSSTDQRLSHSRSVTPPTSLHLLSTTTTPVSRPGVNGSAPRSQPVSILKQPISIKNTSSNQPQRQSAIGSSRAALWAQRQQDATSPPAQSSSAIRETNRRKSSFFAQASESLKLDVKSVLEPHPSSNPAQNLSAVNISLGDTLEFKKGTSFDPLASENNPDLTESLNESDDENQPANEGGDDIVTCRKKTLTQQQHIAADTLARRRKSQSETVKTTLSPQTEISFEDDDDDHEYDNVDTVIATGISSREEFVTKRKPKTPVIMPLYVNTEIAKVEDLEDSDSDSNYTISTPSDNELENMSPVGTLRSDVYHDLENPNSPSASQPLPLADSSSEEVVMRSRRKIPVDESLQSMTFDLDSTSSSGSEHDSELEELAKGVVRQSGVELDGSFHKMCLADEPHLASEEEFTDESSESEEISDSDSDYEKVSVPGAKNLSPKKIQSAAARQQKREEMKRLRIAQEIQRQLQEVEVKTKTLENEGVELEKSLRRQAEPATEFDGDKNKELMQKWFNVIHNKSQLFRYESELMVRAKELELEDRHARLTNQLRAKLLKPESEKSHEEAVEEKKILEELLEVVEQRDELVNMLETERLKERLEDEQLQDIMNRKGFELSPVPYTQVTLKKAYKGGRARQLLTQ